jgi:hypothetical protein
MKLTVPPPLPPPNTDIFKSMSSSASTLPYVFMGFTVENKILGKMQRF